MESAPRVLLIGLPEKVRQRLSEELAAKGCACEVSHGLGDALFRVSWNPPHIVLIDDRATSGSIEAVVETLLEETSDVPIVGIDADPAVDAIARMACATQRRRATPLEAPVRRVLLVDDDADLREALRTHLELSGYAVIEAREGAEALRLLVEERPDVVLLDIMMPGLSGIGFLQRLPRGAPPIVVYSAYLDPDGRQYPNVAAVLRKPVPMDTLLAALSATALPPAKA